MVTEFNITAESLVVAEEITDLVLMDSMRRAVIYHLDYDNVSDFDRTIIEDSLLSDPIEKIKYFKNNIGKIKPFFPLIKEDNIADCKDRTLGFLLKHELFSKYLASLPVSLKDLFVIILAAEVTGVYRDFAPYLNRRRIDRAIEKWLLNDTVRTWLEEKEDTEQRTEEQVA